MKIYSFYTRSHTVLKDVFVSSLKDPYEVILDPLDDLLEKRNDETGKTGGVPAASSKGSCGTGGNSAGLSPEKIDSTKKIGGGQTIWTYKTQKVIDSIRENLGQVILFADIDIKFFQETSGPVLRLLEGKDILFQDDFSGKKTANIGFIAIRCSEKVAQFFAKVLAIVKNEKLWDQAVVNALLEDSTRSREGKGFVTPDGMRWDLFPMEFMPWHLVSGYGLWFLPKFLRILRFDFKKVLLCHATECGAASIPEKKVLIYDMCEKAMKHPFLWKAGYTLQFILSLGRFSGKIFRKVFKR